MGDGTRQREWIENARRATRARPVVLNKFPRWARLSIQRAYRGKGSPPRHFLDMTLVNDDRWRGLFDHWGTSRWGDERTLCTEPYAGRQHIEMALRFADWLGCDVDIGGASWWFPGNTVRIEFRPREQATQ